MIPLIRSLFTPCITKRRAGEIGTSTPVVMPILKIKSKRTLCFVFHVWRPMDKYKGKWWVVSRCELVGCVTTYWGTALLPFPWRSFNSNGITQNEHVVVYKFCWSALSNLLSVSYWTSEFVFWWSSTEKKEHLAKQQNRLNWTVNSEMLNCHNALSLFQFSFMFAWTKQHQKLI